MFLLILSVLLAQQGTAQQTQHTGEKSGHVIESVLAEYQTNFSCVGRVAGYYADIRSGCQLYHMCDTEGRRFTHACPKATLFQQRMMICDHWYMVNCNNSEHDYSANLLIGQHDKPFMSPEEHLHHHTPVYFFTTQQNPSSLQEVTNWKQQHSGGNNNIVSNSEDLRDQISVGDQLHNDSEPSRPSINSTSHNRNINKSQPRALSPPKSTSARMAATQKLLANEYSGSDYNFPVNSQTLPGAYTDNPFFQSLLIKTIMPTLQTPAYISNSSDNSEVSNNPKAQYNKDKTFTESETFDEIQDLDNFRISPTRALPQQPLLSTPKEFSNYLGITKVHNLPPHSREQNFPDAYNNSFFQSLTKTRKRLVSTSTMPHSTELRATTGTSINVDKNEDDSNIVQLHFLDPRQIFFIPESNEDSDKYNFETQNTTMLFTSVPVYSHNHGQSIMHFRHDNVVTDDQKLDCPRCHPHFLLPGRCQPCVIIR